MSITLCYLSFSWSFVFFNFFQISHYCPIGNLVVLLYSVISVGYVLCSAEFAILIFFDVAYGHLVRFCSVISAGSAVILFFYAVYSHTVLL